MIDSIIAQHVLDIGFRGELERSQALCRRHTRELILADRRGPGGTLGSSILYGAMLERRLEVIRGAVGSRGRTLRVRLRARPTPSAVHGLRPGQVRGRDGARPIDRAKP